MAGFFDFIKKPQQNATPVEQPATPAPPMASQTSYNGIGTPPGGVAYNGVVNPPPVQVQNSTVTTQSQNPSLKTDNNSTIQQSNNQSSDKKPAPAETTAGKEPVPANITSAATSAKEAALAGNEKPVEVKKTPKPDLSRYIFCTR